MAWYWWLVIGYLGTGFFMGVARNIGEYLLYGIGREDVGDVLDALSGFTIFGGIILFGFCVTAFIMGTMTLFEAIITSLERIKIKIGCWLDKQNLGNLSWLWLS